MFDNDKISLNQFSILVIYFVVGTSIIITPGLLTIHAKQDAWVGGILGVLIGLFFTYLYVALGTYFPKLTFVEIAQVICGKWIGNFISLIYLTQPLILSALVLRNIGDFLTTMIMPETPIQAIHILFMALVIMGVRLGIGVIARSAEVIFPWFLLLFTILVFAIMPQIEWANIQPIFEHGLKPILRTTLTITYFPYSDLVILMMLFPHINPLLKARSSFLTGSLLGGVIILWITVLCILVLGADETARHIYPAYILAKKISIGNFLQRIEVIVAGMWFLSIFFKMTICVYASCIGITKLLNLQDYRPLTFPLGMILIVYSLVVAPNIVYNMKITPLAWIPHSLLIGFLLPFFLLIITKMKKKHRST